MVPSSSPDNMEDNNNINNNNNNDDDDADADDDSQIYLERVTNDSMNW